MMVNTDDCSQQLAATYYLGSSMPQICWFLTGTGLRLAQEKGLHRRKGAGIKPTVASETEKRVFWWVFLGSIRFETWLTVIRCLVFSDRLQGSFLGRAPALHDEESVHARHHFYVRSNLALRALASTASTRLKWMTSTGRQKTPRRLSSNLQGNCPRLQPSHGP